MLPVREVRARPFRSPPFVVYGIVLANLVAFLWELTATRVEVLSLAFVPRTLLVDPAAASLGIVTSMFLHAGWMHLLGNLWFLWLFGPSVEESLGAKRFFALYLLAGAGAAVAQALVDPASSVPMLGASGAIGGVLAAYVSLFPARRILTLAFVFLLEIPALFFVLEWFAINLLRGVGSIGSLHGGGVAWWAHVGGFLAGLVLVRVLFPRARSDEPARTVPPPQDVVVQGPEGERYLVRTFRPTWPHGDEA